MSEISSFILKLFIPNGIVRNRYKPYINVGSVILNGPCFNVGSVILNGPCFNVGSVVLNGPKP